MVVLLSDPPFSWAVADIPTVISNLRNWIIGILAGLATLFLTFGGLRYLMAGGDPGEVESAKRALKAAAIGYGLAVLAPVLVTVLQSIVGAGGKGGG
ncbi:pilin [Streptomyces sp. NPDC050315]|uniref:pilin n=1 Tax=Streptomyces sp. NPDC050315 TaxID=3155039 RepID=UPI003418BEB7